MNKKQVLEAIQEEKSRHKKMMSDLDLRLKILQHDEAKKSEEAYKKRKELLLETGIWLSSNNILREGDIVQVTGSRAGPYRRIVEIKSNSIVGTVLKWNRQKEWIASADRVTVQEMNKITHIFLNGSFKPIALLMKQNASGNM